MVGLAPSASAVKTLVAEAGIESEILQRFLARSARIAAWPLTKQVAHKLRARIDELLSVGTSSEPGNDNHGDWGMVPPFLGLIVVSVPQPARISAEGDDLASFEELLSEYTPGMRADWNYGGNTLHFYGAGNRVIRMATER